MKSIIVTGGTGYIGSHTVVELIQAGYEVVVVDDLSNSNIRILDQIKAITGIRPKFFQVDLCNTEAVEQLAGSVPALAGIIHFAAFKSVSESVSEPLAYYRNNLVSLFNLLQTFKTGNFVFSSSCTVYGEPDELPVSERATVKPATSPYGNTKQVAEEILRDTAAATAGLNIIALRYFNPVGAHASALIGELPTGVPQNLIPFITQSAIGLRGPVTVYGDDYDTPDGSAIRDYIHVADVAKAHVAALKRMEEGGQTSQYEVFNVGTGKGYSVLEIINAFERITGARLNYHIGPRRPGDIPKVYGDVSLAASALKWRAVHTLDDMIASAWAWEKYLRENPIA